MSELSPQLEQQKFDIQSALSGMADETARLQAEVDENNLAGTNKYPEWWSSSNLVSTDEALTYLKGGDSRPEEISDYYVQMKTRSQIRQTITGWESISQISSMGYDEKIGRALVAKGLRSQSPTGESMRQDMLQLIAKEKACLNSELDCLVTYYNLNSRTELLGIPINASGFDGEIAKALRSENVVTWIKHTEKLYDGDLSWAENKKKAADWLSDAISKVGGISIDEAKRYTFSASKHTGEADKMFLDVAEKFDHFGLERLKAISKATNIYGLEGYSIKQLEFMEKYVTDPESVSSQLKNHDVNLVLINRSGDHNGVLQSTASDIEDGETSQRNLFFEIDRLSDIYKVFVKLKKAGIKPSTLLIASHAGPGQFMVSDDRDPDMKRRDIAVIASSAVISLANERGLMDKGDTGFPIEDTKGFKRLIDEFMQPSRGIDDNKKDIGRKKVIFQSCHMGSQVDEAGIVAGEKKSVGKESVVSKLAKTLVSNGLATLVDIYGAPGGIQMHATEKGMGYSGSLTNWVEGRPPIKAVRVRATPTGIVQGRVKEVKLRR